jgi:hypothetical protein
MTTIRWVDLAGCALITLLALYGVISPQGMYELSYKLGNDIHRRLALRHGTKPSTVPYDEIS